MNNVKFRHEIKHFINYSDYLQIKNRLRFVAKLDTSSGDNGKYKIRSLYFDNLYDKALLEKLNGINNRKKFRIRFYNDDTSFIRLEKKCKINGLTQKLGTRITKEQCTKILSNDLEWIKDTKDALLVEFYSKCNYLLLKPRTIVDYIREAYIFEPGNVRVTFDMDVKSGLYSKDLYEKDLPSIGSIQNNSIILEVKYDEFLPQVITDLIQTNNRQATAISKYASCRIYG
jgi:hypothetical protein